MKKEKTKKLIEKEISQEMRTSYMEYAMSVIISRALPDLRDGLKPVQRRILYSMLEMGLVSKGKFRKSAAVVGETMARYHPHGDAPIYESLVRLAQDFTLRYPLVEGQGNFGSIDGDPPAHQRYTECKLSAIGELMLQDIDKETVDFVSNYDGTRKEPVVLPSPLPNILLNGALGIAVGMATSIPPHNLGEILDCLIYILENKNAKAEDLFKFFQGPDFPTGGEIFNFSEIKKAYLEGKGSILVRAKTEILKEKNGKELILITEIPYLVPKSSLLEQMAKLVLEKRIKGIKDIRDESDKDGLRIVIELQKGFGGKNILNYLFKHTDLEKKFYLNLLVLVDGLEPKVLNLLELLNYFLDHRRQILKRKTEYLLKKSKQRAHIVEGLLKCLLNLDLTIKIIRNSKDRETAKKNLILHFKITQIQAEAILEIKLASLVRLEREKLKMELKQLQEKIKFYNLLLKNPQKMDEEIKKEFLALKNEFKDKRKTKLNFQKIEKLEEKDLIPLEQTIVILTKSGFLKRINPALIRIQKRGLKGQSLFKEDDFWEKIIFTNTQATLLFFTASGKVFKLGVWEIEETKKEGKGKSLLSYFNLKEDKILFFLSQNKDEKLNFILLATKNGFTKKIRLENLNKIKKKGFNLISLRADDRLVAVEKVSDSQDVVFLTKNAKILRIKQKEIKEMGRQTRGIKAISLQKDDELISVQVVRNEKLLLVFENNLGKIVSLENIRVQKRGGKGQKIGKVSEKTGKLISASIISDQENLILVTEKGKISQIKISSLPLLSRYALGVKLLDLEKGDKILTAIAF